MNNTGTIMLSILICSIPSRKKRFKKLYSQLCIQTQYCRQIHPTLGLAEIIYNESKSFNDGGLSIGEKRQSLLNLAIGKYVCYLDDDEKISPDYVETLLRLCNEDKDVCTFRSLSKLANNWALVDMKIGYPNEQINPDKITKRPPWHVCPVKRDIAQRFKFPDSNYGEDWKWFSQVIVHCNTEAHTDKIIHNYNHGAHSEADKIK